MPALGPFYFAAKILVIVFILMWIRGTLPRFRIDQMLGFAWKVLVPAALANLLWVAIVLKLPLPTALQWLLVLAGNLTTLVVALTLLGQAAKRYAARRGLVRA